MRDFRLMIVPSLMLMLAACSASDANSAFDLSNITSSGSQTAAVASVTISPATATLTIGSTATLGATLKDASGNAVSPMQGALPHWESSDEKVATVNATGIVTGVSTGVATITLTDGQIAAKSTVVVGSGATQATESTTPAAPAESTPMPVASVPSNFTGPGLSGLALIGDDFSQYHSTADLLAQISTNIGGTGNWRTAKYNDGNLGSGPLIELDNTVTYNGHPTMKYNQLGGVSLSPGLWPSFPNGTLRTMWFRVKLKFSRGFTTTGTLTNSSNAYKLLGWGMAGVRGSGRVEITNTSEYQLYYGATDTTNTTIMHMTQFGYAGGVATEWSDDTWYDYIIEYSNTSATTSVARLWIAKDGSTPVLRATTLAVSEPGRTMPEIGSVCLGMNFNQVRTANQTQAVWYGQWEVVDGVSHPNPFGLPGM